MPVWISSSTSSSRAVLRERHGLDHETPPDRLMKIAAVSFTAASSAPASSRSTERNGEHRTQAGSPPAGVVRGAVAASVEVAVEGDDLRCSDAASVGMLARA
jgi:hypothetical protein